MTSISIAIPTRNRLPFLKKNISNMMEMPKIKDLDVSYCISATSCNDGTQDFLRSLAQMNKNVEINIRPSTRTRWNWIYLAQTIPVKTDWVWLFGDDDMIVHPKGWKPVHELIREANRVDASLICIPQTKRILEQEPPRIDNLINLVEKFGMHELLGWMTSLIMRRDVFMALMESMRIRFRNVYTDAGLLRTRASPFFHSLKLLEQNANSTAILALQSIVDEQIPIREKISHTLAARQEEHLRERLPYTFTEFKEFIEKNSQTRNLNFYRYVNKTFIDLMINIISEDIIDKKPESIIESKIKELKFISDRVINISPRPYPEIINKLIDINESKYPINKAQRVELEKIHKITKEPYLGDLIGQAFIY